MNKVNHINDKDATKIYKVVLECLILNGSIFSLCLRGSYKVCLHFFLFVCRLCVCGTENISLTLTKKALVAYSPDQARTL